MSRILNNNFKKSVSFNDNLLDSPLKLISTVDNQDQT